MAVSTVTSNVNYNSPRYTTRTGGSFGYAPPVTGWTQQPAQQAPPFTPPPANQPQQPAGNQLDDRTRQPSTLVSYLEDYRGQPNFYSGRSDSEAAARRQQAQGGGQSALSQQLGGTPAAPQAPAQPQRPAAPEDARNDWIKFSDWRNQSDPSALQRYLDESGRTYQAAGSPQAWDPRNAQWKNQMNSWLVNDARSAGYTGADPNFAGTMFA